MVGYTRDAKQKMGLADTCFYDGINTVIHELGHAIGMKHEHIHPDRQVIIIESQLSGYDPKDFHKLDREEWDLTDYDPLSAMHYGMGGSICFPDGDVNTFCDVGETQGCDIPTKDNCDEEKTNKVREERRKFDGLSPGDIAARRESHGFGRHA